MILIKLKTMKKILYIFLGIIAFLVITMFAMGKKYHFETTTVINAPAEKVYSNMNSMKAFNQWNPWLELDPTL